ncbi:zinc ribbon domain-containing protein [Myxococcaceae bacterium JPH2]|nr:zinc ribbon domain-containing protein [Myxococcaceae bacterium JPH2]
MAKTLCPNCGHSPIPRGAEACPECGEPFGHLAAYKKVGRARLEDLRADEDSDQTVFGGDLVTSAVSAHPWPAATMLGLLACAWFLRAGGVLGALGDPAWTFGLVGLDVVLAAVLVVNRGPARLLTQLGLTAQLLATAWLAREEPLAHVHMAYVLLGLVPLGMIAGEPGPIRRHMGLGVGGGLTLVAIVLLRAQGEAALRREAPRRIVGTELGYSLELPLGWNMLAWERLGGGLQIPQAALDAGGVAFGDQSMSRYGVLWVQRTPGNPLAPACQGLLKALGGQGEPRAASRSAPGALGGKSVVYALRTASGARGALGCGLLADGRLVGLAVVATSEEEGKGESAFAVVGEGLALQ